SLGCARRDGIGAWVDLWGEIAFHPRVDTDGGSGHLRTESSPSFRFATVVEPVPAELVKSRPWCGAPAGWKRRHLASLALGPARYRRSQIDFSRTLPVPFDDHKISFYTAPIERSMNVAIVDISRRLFPSAAAPTIRRLGLAVALSVLVALPAAGAAARTHPAAANTVT